MVSYKMIKDFFEGKCCDDEKKIVLGWINASEQNRERFLRWEEMYFLGKHNISDEKCLKAEQKLLARIENQKKEHNVKIRRMSGFMRYAAVFVGIIVLSVLEFMLTLSLFIPIKIISSYICCARWLACDMFAVLLK